MAHFSHASRQPHGTASNATGLPHLQVVTCACSDLTTAEAIAQANGPAPSTSCLGQAAPRICLLGTSAGALQLTGLPPEGECLPLQRTRSVWPGWPCSEAFIMESMDGFLSRDISLRREGRREWRFDGRDAWNKIKPDPKARCHESYTLSKKKRAIRNLWRPSGALDRIEGTLYQ